MKSRKRQRRPRKELPAHEDLRGEIEEVTIERILPGGLGLAHAGGRTLLVALSAPGDRVRARVERVQGRVAFASIEEVLSPSPVRVDPPCPYFGRCGGCDFQQLSYEAQLEAKVGIIRDCLHRIARLDFAGEISITSLPDPWHYRARAQWQHDPRSHRLGYFERGSHKVCDVAACPVLVPELEAALESLRVQMKEGKLPDGLTEFQAVGGDEGASLWPPAPENPAREVSRNINGHSYLFSAEGFFQVNHGLLPALIDAALKGEQGETAVDLYCGVGLFTLPLARSFRKVYGVEANASAVSFARRNLSAAGLDNAAFEAEMVGRWLTENASGLAPVDLLLLDPPRSGADEEALNGILALKPQRIAYVSCDPATLARDIKVLTAAGYALGSVAAFDMFPQTHHVETIARLSLR